MRKVSFFLHQSLKALSLVTAENFSMFCKFLLFVSQKMFLTKTTKNVKKYYLEKSDCILWKVR